MFSFRLSLWRSLYVLASPASGNTGVSALQPCGLVVSLQDSVTSESLDKRCILSGYSGSRVSAVFQMTVLQYLSMGQCQAVCMSVTWRGYWNVFIRLQPQVLLPCSLIGTGCTLAWVVLLSFSDCVFPPFQGCLNFTHCLWTGMLVW